MWYVTSPASSSSPIASRITTSRTKDLMSACETPSACCVETTTASTPTGLSSSYRTVTCDLLSGRSQSTSPPNRAAFSRANTLWAREIGRGISSGVSRQA